MGKQQINELSAVSRFIDKFFEAVKNNTTDRILRQAQKANVSSEAIFKMKEIARKKKDLEDILNKIPLPKKF